MTDIKAIKDRIDIVQLLAEYLPLKKAGANWKTNCPFHHEKSPSFMVHQEKQIWHCFGCGKGGDIFSFIMEMEGLEFPEALKLLAERAGVQLDNYKTEIDKSQKNRLLDINQKAVYFFHRFLLDMPPAKPARDYLEIKRKIKKETIEKWQIGYAPDQWDLLTKYLLQKGCSIDDLIASGLTKRSDDGRKCYDRFRGRIMFPIADVHGNIVGFTGRVLVETENSGGKYVNTPQTLVYDKSRVIYGLEKAKAEIKSKDLVVMVEGQMDVIACHEAGMTNVVAASGTAMTLEQVKLLKRYTKNIAMAFDSDSAGQNAIKKGVGVAMEEGMNIKVIKIPEGGGKDADECLKKDPRVWFKAVAEACAVMQWYFDATLSKINLHDPKEKQKAVDILLPEIIKIPYAVEQDHWLRKLSDNLDVEINVLKDSIKKIKKEAVTPRYNSPKTEAPVKMELPNDRLGMLVSQLFALLFKFPGLIAAVFPELREEYFMDSRFHQLYEIFKRRYNKSDNHDVLEENGNNKPNDELNEDILLLLGEKNFSDLSEAEAKIRLEEHLKEIKNLHWQEERRGLTKELKQAEDQGDKAKITDLTKKIMELK